VEQRQFRVGLSTRFLNKEPLGGKRSYAEGFLNKEISFQALIDHVSMGHAFTAHFRGGYRKTDNFVLSDFLAADVDDGLTIVAALQNEFISKFATFIYTTPSHSNDCPRFRIVFMLEETITDASKWKNALLGLSLMLGSDESIKDAGRLFFGSKNCEIFKIGSLLPPNEVERLIKAGKDARTLTSTANGSISIRSTNKIDPEDIVELSNGNRVPLRLLDDKTSVKCPFHVDRRSSAFVVRSSSKTLGVHCMKCRVTFWCDDVSDYNFDQFDQLADEIKANSKKVDTASTNFFDQYFPDEANIHRYNDQFLKKIFHTSGITLIKSPKGSGKTEALKELISDILERRNIAHIPAKERSRSVLLIGHRRSLIQEAANKLGLECYLDGRPIYRRTNRYAICLDSLHFIAERHTYRLSASTIHVEEPIYFDTIVIDESEQVFRHMLSETIRDRIGTDRAHNNLKAMLMRAKSIYALDADLGLISGHALKSYRPDLWGSKCRLIVNHPVKFQIQRILFRYKSKNLLIQEVLQAIGLGKRCFIACNSRKFVNVLSEVINREFKGTIKLKFITSDNSQSPEERDFVENIKTEFLKIQVLLCSPSLGTGIDITFPNNECLVDEVFGFFYSHVNTHFDVDQQLSRVRNPGRISVWISAHKNRQETHFDVIRSELVASRWIPSAVSYDPNTGDAISDADHPLVMIAAHMISAQRSSKKRMAYHFEKLREQSGWSVEIVEQVKPASGDVVKQAKRSLEDKRIDEILAAKDIELEDYLDLAMAIDRGQPVSKVEKWQYERARLRYSYKAVVTKDLIRQDSNGKLSRKVEDFQLHYS